MTLDANNVRVAKTGNIYFAPLGTTLPTDAATALDAAFRPVGYIGNDGVKEKNDTDNNEITAWQEATVVRKVITKSETSYEFQMIETNSASLSLFYGRDISAGDLDHGIGGTGNLGRVAMVIDAVDGTDIVRRVIASGEVTERGEVQLTNSDATAYPTTITAYPAAELAGDPVKAYYSSALKLSPSSDPATGSVKKTKVS